MQNRCMEELEMRQLLSGAQLNFANFSSLTGVVANGYGSSAKTSGSDLILTDGGADEARSALFSKRVPVATFTSHFTFTINADPQAADGITFVINGGHTSNLGADGFHLGYAGGTFGANSVALAFNTYNLNNFGSTFGFTSGGADASSTVDPTPVDFHSGDTFDTTVTYDGTTLAVAIVDSNTQATFNDSETINLAQVLGGNTAYIGFTGSTGGSQSTQQINSFDFTGATAAPTVTLAASATPTLVTGTKAHLSVTAVSNSGGTLSYAWSVLHVPPGAPTPTIKPNSSATANAPIIHFFKAGTYHLRVTVTDSNGRSTISDLSIVVQQTPTLIKIAPHKALIKTGTTEQFHAAVDDQFGHSFSTQPTITYAIATGGGSIGASSGLFTAGSTIGHLVVSATADDLTGVAGATVIS